ncbi:MAG TPA: hypothetical protein VKY38_01925 [Azoarcus sp.]|nr:hypothetical protein [Azoarcus sp.]
MRARNVADIDNVRHAQRHASEQTTIGIYLGVQGEKVRPLE